MWGGPLVAMLVTLASFGACGGGSRATRDDDRDTVSSPFQRSDDFEPVAFGVEVTGEGRPIIFIPGLGCPGEVWTETVARLGDDYESHVLTLSGFAGREPIDEPLSQAVRRDLTRYIRSRKLDHPVIVGHSMGGFIAFWIASYHPTLVGPVIIVDASPALSGDLDSAKYVRDVYKNATDKYFVERIRSKFTGMTRKPQKMKPIIDLIVKSDRRTIGEAVFEMITTDLRPQVKDIQAPVLVIAASGGYRHKIKKQIEPIPDVQMVVVPNTGHFVMWDDPDAFQAAVEQFLAEHE
jgi:pimeloyl-ACP methyl ester carboxylesterase